LEKREYAFTDGKYYKNVTKEELLGINEDVGKLSIGYDNRYQAGFQMVRYYEYITDREHPFTIYQYFGDRKEIYIDGAAFGTDKNQMYGFIRESVEKFNIEEVRLKTNCYNQELLGLVCSIPKIKRIEIGDSEDGYTLTVEEYKMVKNCGHIEKITTADVVPELKDVEDEMIVANFRNVKIGNKSYEELKKSGGFYLNKGDLTEDNYKYLKYLNPNAKILFSYDLDAVDIIENLKYLEKAGVKNEIIIGMNDENKNIYSNFFANNPDIIKNDNIKLTLALKDISMANFLDYEERLYKLIEPALGLSPLERYLYAYNVVKKLKPYKENEEDKMSSRDVYQILDNEYMVCSGYSSLLGDLLNKLGIENSYYSVGVDVSYDDIDVDQIENLGKTLVKKVGHARREVRIVDPKYGVKGIYLADPTWDNFMDKDIYCHALMSHDQYNQMDRYNFIDQYNVDETFFVHDLKEFYQKVNFWLDSYVKRYMDIHVKEKISEYNPRDYKAMFDVGIEEFFRNMLACIKKIDRGKYQEIILKFPKTLRGKMSKEELQDALEYIGEYIVSNVNNKIKGETLKDAITVLYRDCYHTKPEELEEKVNEVMEYNKNMYELFFPKRYRIMDDGSKIPIDEYENVFDMGEKGRSK